MDIGLSITKLNSVSGIMNYVRFNYNVFFFGTASLETVLKRQKKLLVLRPKRLE